jgi:predicted pyridoxine 5'-phosphate oxidase superfamily flavin-nucleotide-binding protein
MVISPFRAFLKNAQVCVSFVNIFVQKGFKIKGKAKIIQPDDPDFAAKKALLTIQYSDLFPIQSIIEVAVESIDQIIAPSYFLFPETTEESQIKSALKTYNMDKT